MKKRNLKSLKLNKQNISNFKLEKIIGGSLAILVCPTPDHRLCTNSYDGDSIPNPCPSNYPCA